MSLSRKVVIETNLMLVEAQDIPLPNNFTPLSVFIRDECLVLSVLADDDEPNCPARIRIIRAHTTVVMPCNYEYCGCVHLPTGVTLYVFTS